MPSPLIGLTTSETVVSSPNALQRPVTIINQAYVDLVTSFGAVPLLLSCHTPLDQIKRLGNILNGLIIIGGQDIHPEAFGQVPKVEYRADVHDSGKPYLRPLDYQPSQMRDHFEIALYQECKARRLPILGICRGLQLINVAEGGTLHQELPEPLSLQHDRGNDGFIHHHLIEIDTSSRVFSWLKKDSYVMPSLHHQGIDQLGRGLRKSAWSEDGVIEIIESTDDNHFIVGVHGHIEQTRRNLRLYDNLLYAFMSRAALM